MSQSDFTFGRPKLHELGYTCCGKPQGCTNPTDGCAYKQHPYKRWVRGEITLEELNRLNPPRVMEPVAAEEDPLQHALDLLEAVFGCDKGMGEEDWIEFCNEHLAFMQAQGRLKGVISYG